MAPGVANRLVSPLSKETEMYDRMQELQVAQMTKIHDAAMAILTARGMPPDRIYFDKFSV